MNVFFVVGLVSVTNVPRLQRLPLQVPKTSRETHFALKNRRIDGAEPYKLKCPSQSESLTGLTITLFYGVIRGIAICSVGGQARSQHLFGHHVPRLARELLCRFSSFPRSTPAFIRAVSVARIVAIGVLSGRSYSRRRLAAPAPPAPPTVRRVGIHRSDGITSSAAIAPRAVHTLDWRRTDTTGK